MDEALDKYLTIAVDKHCVKTPKAGSSSILNGTVICISKKLASQVKELSTLVRMLGGQYKSTYDTTATHLIFKASLWSMRYNVDTWL